MSNRAHPTVDGLIGHPRLVSSLGARRILVPVRIVICEEPHVPHRFPVDGQISSFLLKLLELSTSMVVRLVLVLIVAPIFTGAVAVFGIISGLYARAYMKAQLPVKREQSKTRAPLIGHLNSTIASLGTCRPRLYLFW